MKTLIALFIFISAQAFAANAKLESGHYSIDPAHSKVGFEISHLVISTVEGRFNTYTGSVDLGKNIEDTKVEASIDAASVDTGNADRDKHLKSPDFFDVEKFPKITFISKKVSGSVDALKIQGDLTMHGVTKPITLEGKYLGAVNDPFGNTKTAFQVKAKIKRKDFGLVWSKVVEAGPVVGDEVELELRIEAGKPIAKK